MSSLHFILSHTLKWDWSLWKLGKYWCDLVNTDSPSPSVLNYIILNRIPLDSCFLGVFHSCFMFFVCFNFPLIWKLDFKNLGKESFKFFLLFSLLISHYGISFLPHVYACFFFLIFTFLSVPALIVVIPQKRHIWCSRKYEAPGYGLSPWFYFPKTFLAFSAVLCIYQYFLPTLLTYVGSFVGRLGLSVWPGNYVI